MSSYTIVGKECDLSELGMWYLGRKHVFAGITPIEKYSSNSTKKFKNVCIFSFHKIKILLF
jgi:hypothetical protein